jgi:MFS family permease
MLTGINFFISFNFFALLTSMPIYVLDVFHMNERQAGVVVGMFAIGILTSRLIAGRFANVVGHKKMLSISIAALVVISSGYFFASNTIALWCIRLLNGFSFGMASNTSITIIAGIVPRERSGEGIGYYSLGQTVATALGPFVGVMLAMAGRYSDIFVITMVLPAIGIAFLPFLRIKSVGKPDAGIRERAEPKEKGMAKFIEYKVLPIAVFALILYMGGSGVNAFVAIFADSIGLVIAESYFFLVNAAVILISRPFVSKLFD